MEPYGEFFIKIVNFFLNVSKNNPYGLSLKFFSKEEFLDKNHTTKVYYKCNIKYTQIWAKMKNLTHVYKVTCIRSHLLNKRRKNLIRIFFDSSADVR